MADSHQIDMTYFGTTYFAVKAIWAGQFFW